LLFITAARTVSSGPVAPTGAVRGARVPSQTWSRHGARLSVFWSDLRRIPEPLAILLLFVLGLGVFVLFFWLALPPALRQLHEALTSPRYTVHGHSKGFEHNLVSWVNQQLQHLPSGSAVIHPIATYGKKGTEAVVGVLFTLAATWYFISERDDVINALVMLSPEHKRERACETSRMTASAAPRRGRSRRRSPSRT
jgi:predicted PurR-regulated permease PerM